MGRPAVVSREKIAAAHLPVDAGTTGYQRMLGAWTDADCQDLATLMARFTDDIDHARPTWFPADGAAQDAMQVASRRRPA